MRKLICTFVVRIWHKARFLHDQAQSSTSTYSQSEIKASQALHDTHHRAYFCCCTCFGYQICSNPSIISQDIEHKHNSKINQGSYLCWKVRENNVFYTQHGSYIDAYTKFYQNPFIISKNLNFNTNGRFVLMQVRTRTFRPGMFRPIRVRSTASSSHGCFVPHIKYVYMWLLWLYMYIKCNTNL